jgi:hypothetical protein
MKNVFVTLLILIVFVSTSKSQELGVRFGNVVGGNVALDAIISLGEFSRVHADLSFGNGVGVDLIWDFVYRPLGNEAFNWYAGIGANAFLGDPFQLGVPFELGIDYQFNIPLSLSLDWRPTVVIIETTDFVVDQAGLNIRYVFGR